MKASPILLVFAILSISLYGCKKKGCTYELAVNYDENAKKDDGSCVFKSSDFLGTYSVTGQCDFDEEPNYNIEIVAGPTPDQVVINNINNDNVGVLANIENGQLSFSEDKGGLTYEGTGYIANDVLTLDYDLCETFYYPCSSPVPCGISGPKVQ
ncbi:MAG: hypothetical protein MI810_25150 [Flavobacteriales bacterium]|nr:hypothetical protein [Flavobacteriales bacterium]